LAVRKCGTKQIVKGGGIRYKDIHINGFKKCEGDPCIRLKHAELQLISHFAASTDSLKGEVVAIKQLPCLRCAQLLYDTGIYQFDIENGPQSEEDAVALELLATRIRLNFSKDGKREKQHTGDSTVKAKSKRRTKAS